MNYRNFGKLDWPVSALGFGCMRLPLTGPGVPSSQIDEPEAIRMIRHAIDHGVNYVDTAYGYHDGKSEVVAGLALLDGYRQKVHLATKSPVWMINAPEDFDKLLDEQLTRLQTDHIDFYLLHALGADRWRNTVLKHGVLGKAEDAIRDGRIRHLGFSFHDEYPAFTEILNGYDKWTFCQIQYNYMDTQNQAGTAGLKLAADKGLAVVVMEPLLGGRLATPPDSIRELMRPWNPADLALQWLWDQPEVSTVLSGMSNMAQVEGNLVSSDHAAIASFSPDSHNLITKIQEAYQSRIKVPCTKCGYCMPCPSGVDIPGNFDIFNYAHLHDDLPGARGRYSWTIKAEARANNCAACHECEDKCPQKIEIADWMPKVDEMLARKNPA
ncbi:MAG: aldo/keto reductase [Capsulimonadaceae bacterium]|nr:aldo/keto reductase [Capsulimonadaceae bacterium]